jgi:hypothetical protein
LHSIKIKPTPNHESKASNQQTNHYAKKHCNERQFESKVEKGVSWNINISNGYFLHEFYLILIVYILKPWSEVGMDASVGISCSNSNMA